MDREKLSSVEHRPRKTGDPIAEKRPPIARKMRKYVYNRHQGSGKDVIPHQTHHEYLPKRAFTMQTHDLQEDDRYEPSTTPMTLHDVPDHAEAHNPTDNPGIIAPEGSMKHMDKPDHTFDCWCLNCE